MHTRKKIAVLITQQVKDVEDDDNFMILKFQSMEIRPRDAGSDSGY